MSSDQEDILAAQRDRESHIGWFADPIFKGAYPDMLWKHYEKRGVTLPTIESSDMDVISVPVDFLGVNYYRASVIRNAPGGNWPYDNAYAPCEAEKKNMNYHHEPGKMYEYLKYLNETYQPHELIIAENGFSSYETPDRYGRIMDYDRIDYLYRHLEQCVRAKADGIPIGGYYVWSFLDDLEWGSGYGERMGLVRVDYTNMQRTIKASGRWYQQVIRERKLVD